MDIPPNGGMNIGNDGLYSSTMAWDNRFDFDEDMDLYELFDLLPDQSVNTNIIPPSTSMENVASELPPNLILNEHPIMSNNIIPRSSSGDKINPYQITLDENDDNDFLSHVFAKDIKHVSVLHEEGGTSVIRTDGKDQENPTTNDLISMPIVMGEEGNIINSSSTRKVQDNPTTNAIILQQPAMPNAPALQILERESSMEPKFTINHPLKISTSTMTERGNAGASNDLMIPNQSMQRIPYLEKLKTESSMKSKFTTNHTLGISASTRKEQESPYAYKDLMFLSSPVPTIPCSERDSVKPIGHPFGKEQENPNANNDLMIPCYQKSFVNRQAIGSANERTQALESPMPRISCLEKLEGGSMKRKLTTSGPIGREQQTPRTNAMILNQERDYMKPKLAGRRADKQQNPKTNGLMLQQPMQNIPTLEKLQRTFMKPKLVVGHPTIETPTRRSEGNFKQPIGSGGSSNVKDEIRKGILNSLETLKRSSKIVGPIRRSPTKTSSRYQPFGRQTSNTQGSDRSVPSISESTFDRPQAAKVGITVDICQLWQQELKEINRKTGIGSDLISSSHERYKTLIDMQRTLNSSEAAETEKQNCDLVGGKSSNQNFNRFPANVHEISDKFKGVAGVQNGNQDTDQGYGNANQDITMGNNRNSEIHFKGNEDGAHEQLQSSGVQSLNAQHTHFN